MKDQKKAPVESPAKEKLIAKKDFIIVHNEHSFEIKEGDSLDHIPEKFLVNLKTEGVI